MAGVAPKVFVVVFADVDEEKLSPEDLEALGVWEVRFHEAFFAGKAPEVLAAAALDCFHAEVPISALEDFSFEVYVDGEFTMEPDDYNTYGAKGVAAVKFLSNDASVIYDVREGRPVGIDRVPELLGDSREAMDAWFGEMVRRGIFFNPDDAPGEIVYVDGGKPMFSRAECTKLEGIIGGFFTKHASTVHEVALRHMLRAINREAPAPRDEPDSGPTIH